MCGLVVGLSRTHTHRGDCHGAHWASLHCSAVILPVIPPQDYIQRLMVEKADLDKRFSGEGAGAGGVVCLGWRRVIMARG